MNVAINVAVNSMYLHLGKDTIVSDKDIVAIFDLDRATIGKITKKYLFDSEKEKKVVNVSDKLPKSFIVCENKGSIIVYISQISTMTLLKRSRNNLNL